MGWDLNAPEFGDLAVGDGFQKHSYPFGIMVNANGERFVDEGADFRNYTYAKYGREILAQPGQFAWQIFDQKVTHLLRDEYRIKQVTKVTANTLEELARQARRRRPPRVPEDGARSTTPPCTATVEFNPNIKDGRGPRGLRAAKSNWAQPLDEPPFEAYAVTCGITFTFGGLRINTDGQVMDTDAADPRPVRRRRDGRRDFLLQLPGRFGPDQWRGVRADRRLLRGRMSPRPASIPVLRSDHDGRPSDHRRTREVV